MCFRLLASLLLMAASALCAQVPRSVPVDEFDTDIQRRMSSGQMANDAIAAQQRRQVMPSADQEQPKFKLSKKGRVAWKKGNEALQKRDFDTAEKQFALVIAEHPDFAGGHLNLGVAEMNLSKLASARQEFEAAAKADPHLTLAFQDAGIVAIRTGSYADAETALRTANRLAPKDLKGLTLLAYVQVLNQKYDSAAATARLVHLEPNHAAYAYSHLVAGIALHYAGRRKEAMAEYQLFLNEDPTDVRADAARKSLKELQARTTEPRR